MSYAIHPVAVSISTLKKNVGSRDRKLVDVLVREFRERFPDLDDLDEETVPMKQAVEHLIMGEKLDQDSGFKYGYALECLCKHVGQALTNQYWSGGGWDWIETFDDALNGAGVPKKVFRLNSQLISRGSPIPLPAIADFPSIGFLKESEMSAILSGLPKPGDNKIDNKEVVESLKELREWLDECVRTHRDLVCFYY